MAGECRLYYSRMPWCTLIFSKKLFEFFYILCFRKPEIKLNVELHKCSMKFYCQPSGTSRKILINKMSKPVFYHIRNPWINVDWIIIFVFFIWDTEMVSRGRSCRVGLWQIFAPVTLYVMPVLHKNYSCSYSYSYSCSYSCCCVYSYSYSDFLKGIFIAQAKCPAKTNCTWKCAWKALKHRISALKSAKSD